jgi:hypothetical protein
LIHVIHEVQCASKSDWTILALSARNGSSLMIALGSNGVTVMSNRTKLATLQRKAERRALTRMCDASTPTAPLASLSAVMIDRDAPRRLPVWRL